MWILESDRQSLTEILLGNGYDSRNQVYAESQLPTKPVQGDVFYLLWGSDPRSVPALPSVVVVANGHVRDFLAWAITYFAAYKPFTAFFRVVEFDTLSDSNSCLTTPSLHGLEVACIGAIISEGLLLSSTYGKSSALTLASCSGLLSYALTRALGLGATAPRIERLKEKWFQARKAADYPLFPDVTQAVDQIFRVLLELKERIRQSGPYLFSDHPSPLADACWQIFQDGRISDGLWRDIINGAEGLRDAHQHMEGTREERVRFFQRVAVDDGMRLPKDVLGDFAFGYLASLIGPGSLSHIEIVSAHPETLALKHLCRAFSV